MVRMALVFVVEGVGRKGDRRGHGRNRMMTIV